MSTRGLRAGKAEILLTIRNQARRGLRQAQRDLNRFAANTARIGAGLLAAGGGLAGVLTPAIAEFSRLEQLQGRFASVFGDLSASANQFAGDLAGRVNTSVSTVQDSLAQFQALARGQGFQSSFAQTLSQELAAATQDVIAFDDTITSSQEAITRLNAVFTGETEPVRRYGADFRKTGEAVESAIAGIQAKGLGFNTQQTETLARLQVLRQAFQRGGITGQAEREVDTLAARFRGFNAALEETRQAIGGAIATQVATLTGGITELVRSVRDFANENPRAIQAAAIGIPILGGLGVASLTAASGLSLIGLAAGGIATLGSALSGLAVPAAALAGVGAASIFAVRNIDSLRNAAASLTGELSSQFQDLKSIADTTLGGIVDALSGGQLELAGKIGLKGLQLAWEQTFGQMREFYFDIIDEISKDLIASFNEIRLDPLATGINREEIARRTGQEQAIIDENAAARRSRTTDNTAELRSQLEALRDSAQAAREKADAEREAKKQIEATPVVTELRTQATEAANRRSEGTFSSNVEQTLAPQVRQIQELREIKNNGAKGNELLGDIANSLSNARVLRYA